MRRVAANILLLAVWSVVAADSMVAGSAFGQASGPKQAGWTTHNDAKGFAIDTPPGWNFTSDARAGRILVQGPRSELLVVWPASIEQPLEARSATLLVQQLARQLDNQLPWSAGTATGGAVRTIGKGPQRDGAAMMTWSSNPGGTSMLFYCVEAPAGAYAAEADTFAAILQSFRVVHDAGVAAKAAGPITFTTWTDPREGAFTISAPQGWRVVGGLYRLSATDIRSGVTMASPDGQIRVLLGDSNLGTFIEPNPMMAYAGLREGMYYGLGDGSQLLIQRYMSGQQAARAYTQTYVSKECSGLQVSSNNIRADVAESFGPRARSEGMPNAQLTGGDVGFTCTVGGTAVRGSVIAATVMPFPGKSGLWYVYRLYGYLAAPGREQDAQRVAEQAVQSVRISPQWQAQQQQTANAAVAADNARSQQIRQHAMQAIQQDQRQTSDLIMKGWEQRSATYDEISRRRENAILGTVDVVDPVSGKQYKIENYSDYHWMNNQGTIVGNSTGSAPGPDWRELVTLP